MTVRSLAEGRTHVEAFRCTGTSPGVRGRARVRLQGSGADASHAVSYEVHGPAHAYAVVVLGGISAGRHLAPTALDPSPGWWPGIVGVDRALDPRRRRLVGIDYLGGGEGEAHRVTTEDHARAVVAVLDALGISTATFVGCSFGGMVALAVAQSAPERVARLHLLCTAHRPHPMATALRSLQRSIVRFGIEAGRPRRAVSLARSLAMTTYRSAVEFEHRFDFRPGPSGDDRFPVEGYLSARGRDFARNVAATRFLALSDAIDRHHTEPSTLPPGSRLLSVDTDAVTPPWLVEELAGNRSDVEHVTIASPFGHDAFLKETEVVDAWLRRGLGRLEEVAR